MDLGIGIGIGLLLGGVIVWLQARAKSAPLVVKLEEKTRVADRLDEELKQVSSERSDLQARLSAESAVREQEKEAAEDKLKLIRKTQEDLLVQFQALSHKALKSNNESFLELAKTQVEHLLSKVDAREQKRSMEMQKMVDPLKESLNTVTKQIGDLEKERVKAYSSLTEQVKGLSAAQAQIQKEASNLVNALRKPTVRGRWGEFHLRRVVELAGLVEHCDFEEQQTVNTDEGRLRPDLVIRLAGGKSIIVDAKTPLDAYLSAIEAEDDDAREKLVDKHVLQVREHVRALAAKSYHDQFDTAPDIVVLFLPAESILYTASQADPSLLEFGIKNRVLIATPMTLIALLHGVAMGWGQERIAENAQKISSLGRELYNRICTMVDHFSGVGSRLDSAVLSYNKAVGSLESRVLVSARRLKEMGAGTTQEVAEIDQIDTAARQLQAPDFSNESDPAAIDESE